MSVPGNGKPAPEYGDYVRIDDGIFSVRLTSDGYPYVIVDCREVRLDSVGVEWEYDIKYMLDSRDQLVHEARRLDDKIMAVLAAAAGGAL